MDWTLHTHEEEDEEELHTKEKKKTKKPIGRHFGGMNELRIGVV
jgi:hypothetical protein